MGGFYIVFGFVLSFFGLKLYPIFVFILGAFITSGGILVLCYSTFFEPTVTKNVNWRAVTSLVVCLAVIGGLIIGYLCTKF